MFTPALGLLDGRRLVFGAATIENCRFANSLDLESQQLATPTYFLNHLRSTLGHSGLYFGLLGSLGTWALLEKQTSRYIYIYIHMYIHMFVYMLSIHTDIGFLTAQ